MTKPGTGVAPPIIVSIHSPRWASRVQSGIDRLSVLPHVHWLLDIESAQSIAIANRHAPLIVECPETFASKPKLLLNPILRLCNNAQNSPLFLLGDSTIEPWQNILLEAGATDVCSSILDFEKTWQRVVRHLKISTSYNLTVEQTVTARLPW